jgi:hypothetical protein
LSIVSGLPSGETDISVSEWLEDHGAHDDDGEDDADNDVAADTKRATRSSFWRFSAAA